MVIERDPTVARIEAQDETGTEHRALVSRVLNEAMSRTGMAYGAFVRTATTQAEVVAEVLLRLAGATSTVDETVIREELSSMAAGQ